MTDLTNSVLGVARAKPGSASDRDLVVAGLGGLFYVTFVQEGVDGAPTILHGMAPAPAPLVGGYLVVGDCRGFKFAI